MLFHVAKVSIKTLIKSDASNQVNYDSELSDSNISNQSYRVNAISHEQNKIIDLYELDTYPGNI